MRRQYKIHEDASKIGRNLIDMASYGMVLEVSGCVFRLAIRISMSQGP
jgi:hypothetical protein